MRGVREEREPLGVAGRYFRLSVTALVIVLIAYQLVMLKRTFVPGVPSTVTPAAQAHRPSSPTTNGLAALASQHLFGEAVPMVAPVEPVAEAPKTTLVLTLTGVLTGAGQAIISSSRGHEATYRIGQPVEGGDGAWLHSVHADRVVLDHMGRLETLSLAEWVDSTGTATAPALPAAVQSDTASSQPLDDSAAQLATLMNIAPSMQHGQIMGLRVKPSLETAQMKATGLQPGDVVVGLEPSVAQSASDSWQRAESLGDSDGLNVTVVRDGVPRNLVIEAGQLDSLRSSVEP